MRKGISPIVAAVLLIAVSISVGVLATTWVRNWILEQTQEDILSCVLDTEYQINAAEYNTTSNLLKLKMTNKNERALYGFGVLLDNGTTFLDVNYTDANITLSPSITATNRLERERVVYLTLNLTYFSGFETLGDTLSEIKVSNEVCSTVVAKTGTITQRV